MSVVSRMELTKRESSCRVSIAFGLFVLWVLSLPLFRVNVVGSLSIDNLLAPAVFVAWVFAAIISPSKYASRRQFSYLAIIFIYAIAAILTGISSGGMSFVFYELVALIKLVLYCSLPILCINSLWQFKFVSKIVVIITAVVCWSAVFGSVGAIQFDFIDVADRAGDTRLDVEIDRGGSSAIISRSAGLVGEFGIMALLVSYTLAVMLVRSETELQGSRTVRSGIIYYWFIMVSVALGVVAAQSRNILLSASVVAMVVFVGSLFQRSRGAAKPLVIMLVFFVVVAVSITAYIEFSDIYAVMLGTGAMKASASARLDQYAWVLETVRGHLLFGVGGEVRVRFAEKISSVHNLWLNHLVRMGLIGLLPLVWLFWKTMLDTYNARKYEAVMKRATAIFGFFLSMIVAVTFFAAQGALIFWFLLGMVIAFNCVVRRYTPNIDTEFSRISDPLDSEALPGKILHHKRAMLLRTAHRNVRDV